MFPVVREKLVSILGDLEIDELFNFVVEHVQQHASPQTIVEGLEPVRNDLHVQFCESGSTTIGMFLILSYRFSMRRPNH